MRRVMVALLLAASLAGCLSSQAPNPDAANATDAPSQDPDGVETQDPSSSSSDVDPDDLPHVHPYWSNRSKLELMDRTVQVDTVAPEEIAGTGGSSAGIQGCDSWEDPLQNVFETCWGRAEFGVPSAGSGRAIVPPGTARVVAEVSWSSPQITGVHLQFQPAFDTRMRSFGVFSEPGTQATIAATDYNPTWSFFPLGWTDDGHSSVSQWRFAVTAYAAGDPVAVADGEVQVKAWVHRTDGELPLEPPHPDWYADNATYQLLERNATLENPQFWWFNRWRYRQWMFPQNPVPPGTEQVLVRVEHPNGAPTGAADPTRPDYTLHYNANGTFFWDDLSDSRTAEAVRESPSETVFRIPVREQMTDSVYSCEPGDSRWIFMLRIHGPTVPGVLGGPSSAFAWHDGTIRVDGVATERGDVDAVADLDPGEPEYTEGCNTVKEYYR